MAALAETSPLPRIRDLTGPLEVYRDPLAFTPIYQQTINDMSWDPVDLPPGRRGRHRPEEPGEPRK